MKQNNPITNIIGLDQLSSYTDEVKSYVKSQGIGLTQADVQDMIDAETILSFEEPENQLTGSYWEQTYE